MIPILYESTEKDFTTLGLGALMDCIHPLVTEERNGLFYLEMDYPVNGVNFSEIKNERIIVCEAAHNLKNQKFVITRITKPIDGVVTIYADHISLYKMINATINTSVGFSGNAETALTAWANNNTSNELFTVSSNIDLVKSGNWSIDKYENLREVLGGKQGSILDLYGGEYKFDNLHVQLLKSRGLDRGVRVDYGNNLVDFKEDEDISSTYTSIFPYVIIRESRDGEYTEKLLTLPEKVLHGKYASKYNTPKIKPVPFNQEEVDTVEKLRAEGTKYLDRNNLGLPKLKIDISFIELSKTLNYESEHDIKDEIGMCDLLTISFPRYDFYDVKMKVVATKWNVLTEQYESLTVGTLSTNFQSQVLSTEYEESFENKIDKIQKDVVKVMVSADGITRNYFSYETPTANNVGDKWFKTYPDGKEELYIWDGIKWKPIITEEEFIELQQDLEASKSLIKEAKATAQQAIEESDKVKGQIAEIGDLSTALNQLDKAHVRINDMETKISEAIGSISADFYGDAPKPPYELNQKWYKTEYTPRVGHDTGYESINQADNVTLDEFANSGLFICINPKGAGEVFDWADWKRIATDNSSILAQLEEGYTYDIQQLEKGYRETLLDYAKSADLNGLATEEYALTVSQTEAGKVSQSLTDYKKSNGTIIEKINNQMSTTEANYRQLVEKVDGEVKKLIDVEETVKGTTTVIQDLTGKTGKMSLTEIRNQIDVFSNTMAEYPDDIAGIVKTDRYNVPVPPYKKDWIWYKDAYTFRQGWDSISQTNNITLDEFSSAGTWIVTTEKKKGEAWDWSDFKRVSADQQGRFSQIYKDMDRISLSLNNRADGLLSQINMLEKSITLTVANNKDDLTSQLTVIEKAINQRVSKGDLIGEINTQAGNVLLRASGDGKTSILNLTKDGTYIDRALIESAHIKNGSITTAKIGDAQIVGAKIKDASIGSAKIIGLDVYKITGNTSEFIKSQWNAINSSISIDGTRLVASHTDGTRTMLDSTGLYTEVRGTKYRHSYLSYSGHIFNLNNSIDKARTVTLPSIWKGRKFEVFISIASTDGALELNSNWALRRFTVGYDNRNPDFKNARFKVYGYAQYLNLKTGAVTRRAVDARYLVIQKF